MINLGNVVGVVRSANPPLEEDGVTEKRYVLWAKIITTSPETYDIHYYDTSTSAWTSFSDKIDQRTAVQINNLFKTDDADTVINTLGEVIQAFQDLPEGAKKVVDALAKKIEVLQVTSKPSLADGKIGDLAVDTTNSSLYIKTSDVGQEQWRPITEVYEFSGNPDPAFGKPGDIGVDDVNGGSIYIKNTILSGGQSIDVWQRMPKAINNLTSTSTIDALSAAMGKQLNDDKTTTLEVTSRPTDQSLGKTGDIAVSTTTNEIYIKKILDGTPTFARLPAAHAGDPVGGTPPTSYGTLGDIFFNTSGGGTIYIKRRYGTTDAWTEIPYYVPSILQGSGTPAQSLGKAGDLFFDYDGGGRIFIKRIPATGVETWSQVYP